MARPSFEMRLDAVSLARRKILPNQWLEPGFGEAPVLMISRGMSHVGQMSFIYQMFISLGPVGNFAIRRNPVSVGCLIAPLH